MTALTEEKVRRWAADVGPRGSSIPVAAGAIIHRGALVVRNAAGYLIPLSGTTGSYAGIALQTVTGGAADGDVWCDVAQDIEEVVGPTVGTHTVANIGDPVYATDDSGDYTHDNTGAMQVGELSGFDGTNFRVRHKTETEV